MYVDPTGHVAAKLRDLVTSAKGTIKWNSKDSSITATVNGVTRTFGYNSFKLVNGSAVIDSKAFDSAFSSKTRTVSTQVGKSTISVSTTVKTSPGQSYTHTGSGTNTYNGNIKQQVKTGIDNKLSGIVNNKSSNNVSTQGKGNSSSTGKGLGSSIVDAYKAHQTSGNIVYDEINFWTLGIPESAKTIWTSEPFSKENIIASLEIAMVVIPEAKGAGTSAKGAIKGLTGSVDDVIKGAGKAFTSYDDVAGYIQKNGKLPDNFITKDQAKALGWDAKTGNLADVAPGKSIGGDIFKNKGNPLPDASGRIWYEADINYSSGFRGTDRILYSNDGLIYKTSDHYKTFTQVK